MFDNLQFVDEPGGEDFVYLETAQNLLKGKAFKLENNQPAADVDGNVKKLAQWAGLTQYLAEPGVTELYKWIIDRILGRFLTFKQVCRNSTDPQVKWSVVSTGRGGTTNGKEDTFLVLQTKCRLLEKPV